MTDYKTLINAATPGPWAHAGDEIFAPDKVDPEYPWMVAELVDHPKAHNAALIVAAVNGLRSGDLIPRAEVTLQRLAAESQHCEAIEALSDKPEKTADAAEHNEIIDRLGEEIHILRAKAEKLAEELDNVAKTCENWADESRDYGWSTHQVTPNRELAGRCRAALSEYRGEDE